MIIASDITRYGFELTHTVGRVMRFESIEQHKSEAPLWKIEVATNTTADTTDIKVYTKVYKSRGYIDKVVLDCELSDIKDLPVALRIIGVIK